MLDTIKEAVQSLLSLIGVSGDVAVVEDKENDAFLVDIKTEDAAILIGRHGETIDALQTILGQIIFKKSGEWKRVIVDVDGYRDKQKDVLAAMANQIADRAKETGQPQSIFDLTAGQRRIVHMVLTEDPEVETLSEGDGRDRHIVVKLKTKSLKQKTAK